MGRIERERHTVETMIRLYCRRGEGNTELCPSCRELLEYANVRLSKCRFREEKSTCQACPVHCYRLDMREKIRVVMRWSGPRMILFHPIMAVRHIFDKIR